MSFTCEEEEFNRFFNRLDRPVEESRPDRQPDRFPSLNEILPLTTSYIAHLSNLFDYVFAQQVFMPLLKAIVFIKIALK